MWLWIIIALVIVIGLVFWMMARKKEKGVDISATPEAPEVPKTPEPSIPETPETPEAPSSSDEEKPM